MGDQHFPLMSGELESKINECLRREKFDAVRLLGDMLDLDMFGKYVNDPRKMTSFHETLSRARQYLAGVRKAAGTKAEITLKYGNHDVRLENYAIRNAPELVKNNLVPTLDDLLELKKHKITGIPVDEKQIIMDSLKITHGTRSSGSGPGYAAHSELRHTPKYHVIMGHCHTQAAVNQHGRWGIEAGCLLDQTRVPYLLDKQANWQQGFCVATLVEIKKGKTEWFFELVQIQNNCFTYNKAVY